MSRSPHVAVVGAGLAGLIAAAEVARAGVRVTVLDGAGHAGGRAHTTVDDGFHRNLGPHAVYRRGALARELRRLGVPVRGGTPNLARARVLHWGTPVRAGDVARFVAVTTRLLVRTPPPGTTVTAWLDGASLGEVDRSLVQAAIRTATYAHAPDVQDARSACSQLRTALAGVTYVAGGWSTLVDGLVTEVRRHGGTVRRSTGVRRVLIDGDAVHGVELRDGTELVAGGVVLAVGGPRDAGRLLGPVGGELGSRDDVPVRMATLDVALDRLPRPWPAQVFGAGDDPRYWLAQSRFTRLAPGDGAVVHVARYLAPGERADAATRADLESLFDEVQPGWRPAVRTTRFLPDLTVAHALPLARTGGLDGRADVATAVPGVAIAGDAIGAVGQLADAAAASAVHAARTVLADLGLDRGRGPAAIHRPARGAVA